jgi:DNA gyrase/topoisomerase IV subunit A
MICGASGIRQYLETGRGSVKVRGKAGIEELKGWPRTNRYHGNSLWREPRHAG